MSALQRAVEPECQTCGHTWVRDPCFEVACPTCGANAGTFCVRPSGYSGPFVDFHAKRDLLAAIEGHYDHDCIPDPTVLIPETRDEYRARMRRKLAAMTAKKE